MKSGCLGARSLFFAIAILLLNQRVTAKVPVTIRAEIQQACFANGASKNLQINKLEGLCGCIAKHHFESAAQNPSGAQATADLKWFLQLYRIKDPKKIIEYSKSNEAIFEYDFEVAEQCQNEMQ